MTILRSLMTLTLCVSALTAAAQVRTFWSPSYRQALARAEAGQKMVFAWLGPPSAVPSRDKALMDSLQASAIGVQLRPGDSAWEALERGRPEGGPFSVFVFTSAWGVPLARGDSALPLGGYLLAVLGQAQDRRGRMEDVKALEEERRGGNNDPLVLEGIIAEKEAEGLPTDSLLQVYVDALSGDTLTSVRVVRFLALQAPLLNSEANQWLRQDPGIFREAWNSLSTAQQVQINSAVIRKTCARAAQDRDVQEARLAAVFAANTHLGSEARVRAFQGVMMDYYYGAGDTIQYEDAALAYYDHFLMPLNADSLKTQDSLLQRSPDRSVSHYVSGELRKGGLRCYRLGVTDTLLRVALSWVSRANELDPIPEGLDLEARLIYQKGDKARAGTLEKRALGLAKAMNVYDPDAALALAQIQEGKPPATGAHRN